MTSCGQGMCKKENLSWWILVLLH